MKSRQLRKRILVIHAQQAAETRQPAVSYLHRGASTPVEKPGEEKIFWEDVVFRPGNTHLHTQAYNINISYNVQQNPRCKVRER